MKTLTTILFLLLTSKIAFTQVIRPEYYNKDFGDQWTINENISKTNYSLAKHQYLIQILFNNSVIVESFIQGYIQDKLDFSQEGDMEISDLGANYYHIMQKYAPKIQSGAEVGKFLQVESKYFEIESLKRVIVEYRISGYWDYVLEFFVRYYPTKINIENINRNEEVTSSYLEDIAVFRFLNDGTAEVVIKSRKYDESDTFINEIRRQNE